MSDPNADPVPNQSTSACGGVGYVPIPPRLWSRAGGNNSVNCAPNYGYAACGNTPVIYSTYDLDQRRKVEILKYSNNGAHLSRAQQYSMASRNALTRKKSWATQTETYTNPNVNNLPEIQIPGPDNNTLVSVSLQCNNYNPNYSLTSGSDVPGSVIPLFIDNSIPLYNYRVQRTYLAGNNKWPMDSKQQIPTPHYNPIPPGPPPPPPPTVSRLVAFGRGTNVPFSSNSIAHSSDNGATWTDSVSSVFYVGNGGAYNESTSIPIPQKRWVAVGNGVGGTYQTVVFPNLHSIAYSDDNGITWTGSASSPFTIQGNGVDSNSTGNLWFAVGGSGGLNSIARSTDGINWTSSTNMFSIQGNGVANATGGVNGSVWVAVGEGTSSQTSIALYNGTTWTNPVSNPFTVGNGVAYNIRTNRWVAVGQGITNSIAYSDNNGTTWTGSTLATGSATIFTFQGNAVATNTTGTASMWVAVGSDSFGTDVKMAYSSGGATWTMSTPAQIHDGLTGTYRGITWTGNRWIAVGNGFNNFAYSSDGINWYGITPAVLSLAAVGTGGF